ncbi:hypothetical protein [Tolypothrix sp. PCC 7601]|uniref:hypothetical protein n=1 Tax=Tolypothrix sp. PCC 7601 TaxID=1188 RepID=UPI0005EAC04D|nr:hypothetical protein [Tolypothrix sp. PCC 7601]EKE98973.1 hypothetical protein FDUTEX481_03161 [Tolypothrix sp. PCC 7601]UYD35655.1 hypothetical protein HG267_07800 [Tolypothrix sp. PCC 7601]BAY94782.1 hypothetical protein NIES3275_68360 [Microchaete diplosiphon NIES-3275]
MKQLLNEILANCDRPQALGIATLICLAQREATTVEYQFDEMNFSDVPPELVIACDQLTDDNQLELVCWLAHNYQTENYTKPGAIA